MDLGRSLGLGETWPRPLGSDRQGARVQPKLLAAASVDEDLLATQPVLYQQQPIGARERASLLQRSNVSSGSRTLANIGSLGRCGSAPCIASVDVASERAVGRTLLVGRESEASSRFLGGADWQSDPGVTTSRASSSAMQQENMRLREEIQAMCATIKNQSSQLSQLWAGSNQSRSSTARSQLVRSESLAAPSGSSEAFGGSTSMMLGVAELSRQRVEGLRSGRLPLFSPSLDYRLPLSKSSYPSGPKLHFPQDSTAGLARTSSPSGDEVRSPEPSQELSRLARPLQRISTFGSPRENGFLQRPSPNSLAPSPVLSAAPALDDLCETVVSIGSVGAALEATSTSAQDDLAFSSPLRFGMRPPRNSAPPGSANEKKWCSSDEARDGSHHNDHPLRNHHVHGHHHHHHEHRDSSSAQGTNALAIKNFDKLMQAGMIANGFSALEDMLAISVAEINIAAYSFPQEILSFEPDEGVLFSRYHGGDTQRNIHCNIELFFQELAQLEQLQEEARKLGRSYYKSITVMATRYLSLARGKLDKAILMMDNTQAWRREFFSKGPIVDNAVIHDFSHGMLYFTGRDSYLRPILVVRAERVPKEWGKDGSGVTRITRLLVFCMEYLRRYMLCPGVVENIVVLVDLKNLSASEVPVTALKRIYAVLSHHYVVMVYRFYLMNKSWVLNPVESVLKPILTERQRQKLISLDNVTDILEFVAPHHIEEDLGGTRPNITQFFPFPLLPGPFDAGCRVAQRTDAVPNVHNAFTAEDLQGKLWQQAKNSGMNSQLEYTKEAEDIFKACNVPFHAVSLHPASSRLNEATLVSSCRSSPRSLHSSKDRLPRLRIRIESATGLYDGDFFGNLDVFCVCEIPGRVHTKHTTAVSNKRMLVWDEEFEIENYVDGDPLQFSVLDKHIRPTPDDLLGETTLRSTQFFPDGWYGDLDLGVGSGGDRRSLKVKVEVLALHPYEVLSPGSARSPFCKKAKIKVMMLGARGLRYTDLAGKSDPYCVCEVPGKPRTKFETKTVHRNPNPDWNQEWEPPNFEIGDPLLFTIFDKVKYPLRDEVLGKVLLSSDNFFPDGWFGEVLLDEAGPVPKATLLLKIDVISIPQTAGSIGSARSKNSNTNVLHHGGRCLVSKPKSPRPTSNLKHNGHHAKHLDLQDHQQQQQHHGHQLWQPKLVQPCMYTELPLTSADGTLVLGQPLDNNLDSNRHRFESPRAFTSSLGHRSPCDRLHSSHDQHTDNEGHNDRHGKAKQNERSVEASRRGIPVVVQPHVPPPQVKRKPVHSSLGAGVGRPSSFGKMDYHSEDELSFASTPRLSKSGDLSSRRHSNFSDISTGREGGIDGLSVTSEADRRQSVTSVKPIENPISALPISIELSPSERTHDATGRVGRSPPALALPKESVGEIEHSLLQKDEPKVGALTPATEHHDEDADNEEAEEEDEHTEASDDDAPVGAVEEFRSSQISSSPKEEIEPTNDMGNQIATPDKKISATSSSTSGSSSGEDSPVAARKSVSSVPRGGLSSSDDGPLDSDVGDYGMEGGIEENGEEEEREIDEEVEPSDEDGEEAKAVNRAVKQGSSDNSSASGKIVGHPKVKPNRHSKGSLAALE